MAEVARNRSLPVGTVAEIIREGGNPQEWGSCAAPNSLHTLASGEQIRVRGCRHYNLKDEGTGELYPCPIRELREGKKTVPCNTIKFMRVDDASREDPMECFNYMESLHLRSLQGNAGEAIAIVGYEGEPYNHKEQVAVTPNYVSGQPVLMKLIEESRECPAFPRPGEPGSALNAQAMYPERISRNLRKRAREARMDRQLMAAESEDVEGDEQPMDLAPVRRQPKGAA